MKIKKEERFTFVNVCVFCKAGIGKKIHKLFTDHQDGRKSYEALRGPTGNWRGQVQSASQREMDRGLYKH